MEIRKITGDDYIPDMIETINHNFDAAKEAIDDLNEIINDGEAELKNVKVNQGGETTEVSYQGTGRMINNGNVETNATVKGRNLEVSHISSFGGNSTFNGASVFNENATFNGANTSFASRINIQKEITIPTRTISSIDDIGVVGAIAGFYNCSIENDYCIILNQAGSDIDSSVGFRLTNGKPNQVIQFVVNTASGDGINVELGEGNVFNVKMKESVTLVWNQISEVENTGEWVIIAFSSFNQ